MKAVADQKQGMLLYLTWPSKPIHKYERHVLVLLCCICRHRRGVVCVFVVRVPAASSTAPKTVLSTVRQQLAASKTGSKTLPGTVRQQLAASITGSNVVSGIVKQPSVTQSALKLKMTSVTSQPTKSANVTNKPTSTVASAETLENVIESVARGGGEIKRSSSGRPLIKKKQPLEELEKIPEKKRRGRPSKAESEKMWKARPSNEMVITIDDAGKNMN